ncbi:MAG: FxLD family lanthipeptide [Actinobacteria bacterium]|nr:FxLD family lanthipeptide [Actinomycetota bacterium]
MSIDTIEMPAVSPGDMAASRLDGAEFGSDPFDLDISFIEHCPNADTVIAMTDDGCGSTCPSACTTSVSA